jgi:cysteine synthase
MGVSRYLKGKDAGIKCFAVEPQGAEVIKGEAVTKPLHLLQGENQIKVSNFHLDNFNTVFRIWVWKSTKSIFLRYLG